MIDIQTYIKESAETIQSVSTNHTSEIQSAIQLIVACLKSGNTVFLAGNGGSATQASHIAAEFTGRYKLERTALPAIALTVDIAALTAISNDYGYDKVFSRQVEALGREGDVLITLSTSGGSDNLVNAVNAAKEKGMKVITLLGKTGGKQKDTGDIEIIVQSDNTPHIQEAHITILHLICELAELELFK